MSISSFAQSEDFNSLRRIDRNNFNSSVLNLIRDAKYSKSPIYISHFIINEDTFGKRVLAELMSAASNGSSVYIVYDAIGPGPNFPSIKDDTLNALHTAGVKVRKYAPLSKVFNYVRGRRMHDKLIIGAGRAIIGSSSMWKSSSNAYLYETDIEVRGPILLQMQKHFWDVWAYASDLNGLSINLDMTIDYIEYAPPIRNKKNINRRHVNKRNYRLSTVEYVHDSGLKKEESGTANTIFKLLNSAKKSIKIVTPYFFPTSEFQKLLKMKSASIEVEVITNPASVIASELSLIGLSYQKQYDYINTTNISVWEYQEGFLHSKIIIIDNKKAFIGSFNFDPLSINKNTENGLIFSQDGIPVSDGFDIIDNLNTELNLLVNSSEQIFNHGKQLKDYSSCEYTTCNIFMKMLHPLIEGYL